MASYKIKKGHNLRLVGAAQQSFGDAPKPQTVAVKPPDFKGVKPKLLVKEGEKVRGGAALFLNKKSPDVKFVSPVPGTVESIVYGPRRAITAIVIKPDWAGEEVDHGSKTPDQIDQMARKQVLDLLLESGAFARFRQRPFDCVPDPAREPKSIFVNAMDSAPNAGDPQFVLANKLVELQLGIAVLKKLTRGKIHVCASPQNGGGVFNQLKDVEFHTFAGPHPAGLVGTHIHFVDPINKGDIVWYIHADHLAAVGTLMKTGRNPSEKTVCVSGSGANTRKYFRTLEGAMVKSLVADGTGTGEMRFVSGTALYGDTVDPNGHIGFYPGNLQVVPEGRHRKLFDWALPGFSRFSASSRVFASSLLFWKKWDFDTNLNGGHRSIIWTDVYDDVMPLDIYTNFLVKAILAEDVEEMEELGILEVGEEDFALATYLCPSKTDISGIVARGLDVIEKEGY